MLISNKIYKIEFDVNKVIFVNSFYIEPKYRNRGYSRRIMYGLSKKYNKPIHLLCFPTLFNFYKKIGFNKVCDTVDGYIEMKLK